MVKTISENIKKVYLEPTRSEQEKAILVFIKFRYFRDNGSNILDRRHNFNEDIEELKNLTVSAGAKVSDVIIHSQDRPNPKYFISKGKLDHIRSIIAEKNIDLIIFDEEITPVQQSNLQDRLEIKVIDRTALILDIFAQRAHSREGKLQVELAQLNYILPRLRGKGIELSRLGGGIGTRGPGETKLEVDRRKIRNRISQLNRKIDQIGIQRDIQRKQREEKNIFQISLVGYTNSGKSTLLNTATDSNVLTKNMLFSTLDSTTRKLMISQGYEILISDTVGFIEKLPHQLIASFKSTLEEVRRSDLLLLIVDVSNPNFENHILSVRQVLKDIEVYHKPVILVFNKIDKINSEKMKRVKAKYKNAVFISALKRIGLENLYSKIKKITERHFLSINVKIPYSDNKTISFIYDNCQVLKRDCIEDGMLLLIKAHSKYYPRLSKYIYKGTRSI